MFGRTNTTTTNNPNPNGDVEVNPAPNDAISCITWNHNSNHLLACGWDGMIYCLEVNPQNCQFNMVASQQAQGPLLSCSWGPDGIAFFAGADNKGYMWNLQQNVVQQIANHDQPIKFIKYNYGLNVTCTASWDGTSKFWDNSNPNPVSNINLGERCWGADMIDELAVYATAPQQNVNPVKLYDLRNMGNEFRSIPNPFDHQISCVECYPDKSGYALGAVEGRVAIRYVDQNRDVKGRTGSFTFKCHRGTGDNQIYPVNDISFTHRGTFATAGGDGSYNFWDKDSRNRLKQFGSCYTAITACAFNSDASVFAYAVGYDWSKGINGKPNNVGNHIYLHKTQQAEINPK